jgi:folate-dependent phosphoribosylglycinamide formyltransferase PurN
MPITPLFDPEKAGRPMRVAAFMSGTGTNIIRLIDHEDRLRGEGASPFEVVFVFSDTSDGSCHGERIALTAGIPYISYDIRRFHELRGIKRRVKDPKGLAARRAYDRFAARMIKAFDIDVIALGGYMSYITLNRCINVHPADLSIRGRDGKRRYVGDHAVRDAILAGETTLRTSTLWTDEGVDTGPLLMVSSPLEVRLKETLDFLKKDRKRLAEVVTEHQNLLKEIGDWKVFPKTVEMVSRGRIALDEHNEVFVDGKPAPDGYRE